MAKIYISSILKRSIELNGVEIDIQLSKGMIGFFPVFRTLEDAEKWNEPHSRAEVLAFEVTNIPGEENVT